MLPIGSVGRIHKGMRMTGSSRSDGARPLRRPFLGRPQAAVVAFTLLYMIAAGYFAVRTGNAEFRFYIGVMVVLIGAVAALHARVRLSTPALACLSVWGLAHMAGGLVHAGDTGVLYNYWLIPGKLKYDQLVHAYGFGVSTWVCWEALRTRLAAGGDGRPTLGVAVLCALAGMGLGALNEVVEFAATLLMPETNVGGYANNATDLVFNAAGSVIAAVVILAVGGRGGR